MGTAEGCMIVVGATIAGRREVEVGELFGGCRPAPIEHETGFLIAHLEIEIVRDGDLDHVRPGVDETGE